MKSVTISHERGNARTLILLPGNWNGRFVGIGSGGAAGVLREETLLPYAKQGFATAMTDLGTAGDPKAVGWNNPSVVADFGHRATHEMTLAAKDCIKRTYGCEPEFSYFDGASTGGQQAFAEAQRHPADYDGILAGVPAHSRTKLHAYFLWNWQKLHTADGKPLFSKAQERAFQKATLEAHAPFERDDKAKLRYTTTPYWAPEILDNTLKIASKLDTTLGREHIDALRLICAGPRHADTGKKIFGGFPPGGRFDQAQSNLYLFNWVFGPDINYATLDFGADYDHYLKVLSHELDADNENLDSFRELGGKMIVYAGTQDSCVPCPATIEYWQRLAARYGGAEAAREFFRLYILPGREHFGGKGIQELRQPLKALQHWREKGTIPKMEGISCTQHRTVVVEPM